MITYEFTDINKAHAFHAEALQYGAARWGGQIAGWHPETFIVEVGERFDAIVEARRAKAVA